MMPLNGTLHSYQKQAMDFAIAHPKCGLFLELGLGKTLVSLAAIEAVYPYETGHILVIAPKSIARATWISEIKKWGINIPYKSLIVNEKGHQLTREKRLEAYKDAYVNPVRTIYFINRDLLSDLVANMPLNEYGQPIWYFQTVIVDELQSFKSPSSDRFKALKKVSPAIRRFIGLTGTPTPNGIEDIWSQIYLMDSGLRLEKNITRFRNVYMHPGYKNPNGIVCSWYPKAGAENIIYQKISDIAISMKNTQIQLPPINFINDKIYLSEKDYALYRKFAEDAVLEFDFDAATAANAAVMTNKLSQMASGSLYTVDENGNPTGRYQVIHKEKLERLKYIRENTDDNLLVVYQFQSEADMIMKYCQENKISCHMFDSNKSAEILEEWNKNRIPMLLIQPGSAGFGLNFQYACHTMIWYTLPFNLEHYLQTIGRIYRQGQTKEVYIHRLMTQRTIDSKILQTLMSKNADMRDLLDALEYNPNLTAQQSQTILSQAIQKTTGKNNEFSLKEKLDLIRSAINNTSE